MLLSSAPPWRFYDGNPCSLLTSAISNRATSHLRHSLTTAREPSWQEHRATGEWIVLHGHWQRHQTLRDAPAPPISVLIAQFQHGVDLSTRKNLAEISSFELLLAGRCEPELISGVNKA